MEVTYLKRNIIIIGPSRAGKTTLAKKLNVELNYSVIGTDDLVIAFEEGMPRSGIGKPNAYETSVANITSFLVAYVNALAWRSNYYNGTKYAFEGGYFDKLVPIWETPGNEPYKDYWKTQYLIIGLVYHNQTPEQLFEAIRKHDVKDDWTSRRSNDELRSHAISSIEYSRYLYEKFQEYNLVIYDVSNNREQVLDKIVSDIKVEFGMA